jgi:hypothetical protein
VYLCIREFLPQAADNWAGKYDIPYGAKADD